MLNMDFAEPEQDGQDEIGGKGPYGPVVDAGVQNELMQMDPLQRLPALDGLIQQALGGAVPEEEENDIAGAPWFECDAQNLRILKALTLDSMGRVQDALPLWEACVDFAETKLPPNDESTVVVHEQTALCAFQCGETKKSKAHAARALLFTIICLAVAWHDFAAGTRRNSYLRCVRRSSTGQPTPCGPLHFLLKEGRGQCHKHYPQ